MKSLNVIYRVTALIPYSLMELSNVFVELQVSSDKIARFKRYSGFKKYSGQLDLMENFPVNIPIM